MITKAHFWAGILLILAAIVLRGAFPRYDVQPVPGSKQYVIRTDRWTGAVDRIDTWR
jgi:hypothetical protein